MLEELEINKNLLREKTQARELVQSKIDAAKKNKKAQLTLLKKQMQEADKQLVYMAKLFNRIVLEKQSEISELNISISLQKNKMQADEFILVEDASNHQPDEDHSGNAALSDLLSELSGLTTALENEQEAYAQECAELKTLRKKLREEESATIVDCNTKIESLEFSAEKLDDEIELLHQQFPHDSMTDSISNIMHEFAESEALLPSRFDNVVEEGIDDFRENEPLIAVLPRIHDRVESYLKHLDLDISDLLNIATSQPKPQLSSAGLQAGLLHILKAETSRLSYLRWANLETLLIKLMQGRVSHIDLAPGGINLPNFISGNVIFPSGRALPVEKNATRRRRQITAAIVEGTEHSMMSLLHMTLYSVLVYQLLLPYLEHGAYTLDGLRHIFKSYEEVGTNSIVRLLAKMQPEVTSSVVIGFMVASVFILATRQAMPAWQCDDKKADALIEKLDNLSFGMIKNNMSFLFPFRWLPPFSLIPYFNFESTFLLAEHYILHQSGLSDEKRLEIWNKVKDLALRQNKLVRREAMHAIGNIAHGIALKDLVWLHDQGYTRKELGAYLYIKTDAYGVLHYLASRYQLDNKTGILNQYVYPFNRYLYANYLLWWLNDSNRLLRDPRLSPLAGLIFLAFKLGKLILQAKLFEIIIKSIIKAVQCPDLPYVQFGKEIPVFANRLDVECFKAIIKLFRALPGQERQPVSFVTDIVSQFDFWVRDANGNKVRPGLTELDLSGKYLRAYEVAAILDALAYRANGIDLVAINLDSQYLYIPCYYQKTNCSFWFGASSLVKSFRAWPNLQNLSMANNQLDGIGNITSSIQDFGRGLQYISSIIHFNASASSVGSDNAGILLGNLGFLTNLQSLDLSINGFDNIKPLGESLAKLTNLQKLVLTGLSLTDLQGEQDGQFSALSHGLAKLYQLIYLDLSSDGISSNASTFEQIGLSLQKLTALEVLNLGGCASGAEASSGFTNIAIAVGFMPHLKTLHLDGNSIGRNASQVVAELALSLGKLKRLNYLNIDENFLGLIDNSSFDSFISQLARLPSLSVDMINNDLNETYALHIIKKIPPYRFIESFNFLGWDVRFNLHLAPAIISSYLAALPINATRIFPSQNAIFFARTNESLIALANGLSRLRNLNFLGVANDQSTDGAYSDNVIMFFYSKLKYLSRLNFLALGAIASDNITLSQNALGNSISFLLDLKTLEIGNMRVWSPESNAITNGLCQLSSLEILILEQTRVFLDSPKCSASLAQSFPCLTNLRKLDLSENSDVDVLINRTSVNIYLASSFGSNLRYLTKLENLNLEDNYLGYTNISSAQSLFENLHYLTALKSIMLGSNYLEVEDIALTKALGNSLATLVNLASLDLGANLLGNISTEGVELIGRNLRFLRSIQSVELSSNLIGLHGTAGIDAILSSAKTLPTNVTIRLYDNSNITSQASDISAQQKYKNLNQSCNDRVCHANQFHLSSQQSMMSSPGSRLHSFHLIGSITYNIDKTPYDHADQTVQQCLVTGLYFYALLKQSNMSSSMAFHTAVLFITMQSLDFPVVCSALMSGLFVAIFNAMNLTADDKFYQAEKVFTADSPIKREQQANDNCLSRHGLFRQKGASLVESAVIMRPVQKTSLHCSYA